MSQGHDEGEEGVLPSPPDTTRTPVPPQTSEAETDKAELAGQPVIAPDTPDEETSRADSKPLVAAIGASAGGLEAFRELFSHLNDNTGIGYVVIQHMAAHSSSVLTEILQRETRMPVIQVINGTPVEPNHVYVMPPAHDMIISQGTLQLTERRDQDLHLPIDTFFTALADDMGARAIGIILSGTASDGVLGLKQIKAVGGLTFAQDPGTARYPDMPRSAIAAHCVDFILAPANIARELGQIGHLPLEQTPASEVRDAEGVPDLNPILRLLRDHTGHDFSYYKRTTLQRRIERQMGQCDIDTLAEYVRFLQENPKEINNLFEEVLINVTGFFRDPEVFDYLRETVIPRLLEQHPDHEPLRIWVPGCASGEEAYSLAICLLEVVERTGIQVPINIFATDIDEHAVKLARDGRYSAQVAERLTPLQLERYFIEEDSGYRIKRSLRELCVFAVHNVVTDPPFSRIDLISCRNLLIYLGQILQKKLIPLFHYALKPGGYLLLGLSETIGRHAELFTPVDNAYKLYQKVAVTSPPLELPSGGVHFNHGRFALETPPTAELIQEHSVEEIADHLLLEKYVPPGVLIDAEMNILQFRGRIGSYLEPSPGRASLNLLRLARNSLVPELRAAVVKAIQNHESVQRNGIRMRSASGPMELNLTVIPVGYRMQAGNHYLVLFEEAESRHVEAEEESDEMATPEEVSRLREELTATKEYLHSVIEQQEIANEEARSANEEIQASNEELQSINEELETAKEELQSTNEELATVNDELDSRNRELERANDDMQNLISSVNLPLIMVGSDLRIRLFTPLASKAFNLIPEDVGRPIIDLKQKISIYDLDRRLLQVIETLEPYVHEVQDEEERWYELNIRPYKTADHRIDGAVMVFLDINDMRHSLEDLKRARDFSSAVIAAMQMPLLVLDEQLRVEQVSDGYLEHFQTSREAITGCSLSRLAQGQWADPGLRAALDGVLRQGGAFAGYALDYEFESGECIHVSISGQPVIPEEAVASYILMTIDVGS